MFDLATAKTRLGIVGTLQDTQLNVAIGAALNIAEKYCDRFFMEQDEVEDVVPHMGHALQLSRYPLTSIANINLAHSAGNVGTYHMNKGAGIVYLDGGRYSHEVTVSYKGGYDVLPADLELALWAIFDAVWSRTPGAGAAVGAATTATGSVDSITVPDVGTIKFSAGGSAAGAGAGGGAGGYITDLVASLLEPYRRRVC
jgi:hypothetical protein